MMNRITDHSDGLVKTLPCKATDVSHFDRYKKLVLKGIIRYQNYWFQIVILKSLKKPIEYLFSF